MCRKHRENPFAGPLEPGYIENMTAVAEKLARELQNLSLEDLGALRDKVNKLMHELNSSNGTDHCGSNEDFEAALAEVIGCSAGASSLERLLQERERDLEK